MKKETLAPIFVPYLRFLQAMQKVRITPKDFLSGLILPIHCKEKKFWHSAQQDASWESQSLPIGNGSIGANILGSVEAERITFNEKTLWRGGPIQPKEQITIGM